MKRTLLATVLLLSACGTPQEQCIDAATRDMKVVEQLIAVTEGNLARGYAIENVTELQRKWIDCTPLPTLDDPEPNKKMCFDEVPTTTPQPVAIDLAAESAKLDSLLEKRRQQSRAAEASIAECKAIHSE